MSEKKIVLEPKIEEQKNIQPITEIDKNKLLTALGDSSTTILNTTNPLDSDTFFKNIVNQLNDKNNISLKTEYLNVTENFVGTKLEFLSKYGNMPYLKEFVNIFEIKRVSLERKGRKELIMALQNRQQEIEQQNKNLLNKQLGLIQ